MSISNLASHSKSTRAALIELLVALLRDSDVNNVALGFNLLRHIADSPVGAEAVVAANALHYFLDGLGSPSSSVRWRACQLMQVLAEHESTAAAVIELHPCKHLVSLSSTAGTAEASYASDALVAIANWPDGAEAIVAARPEMVCITLLDTLLGVPACGKFGTAQVHCGSCNGSQAMRATRHSTAY
ncbi:hypothetical protein FB451DRAFT_450952 [Mycena latifolia]|nr:hypothetical protein FB451DRAFT_450952 [Mycena latifolia]